MSGQHPRALRRRTRAGYLAIVLAGTLAAGCSGAPREAQDKVAAASVDVTSPRVGAVPETIEAYGTVTVAPDRLAVLSSATGGRVQDIRAKVGDHVARGQVLVQLSADPAAQADLAKARTELALAKRNLERQQRLVKAGLAPGVQAEEVRASYDIALAEVRAKQQAVALASQNATLASPLAGVVTEASVSVGSAVGPQTPLMSVADLSQVWVEVGISPQDLGRVHLGEPVEVKVSPGGRETVITGKVTSIGRGAGPETQRVPVRVGVGNPAGLLQPGMFAHATLLTGEHAAVTVPKSALIDDEGQQVVYLAQGSKAVRRPVKTGASVGDAVEVVTGLATEDLVIASGSYGLSDQSPIQVRRRN